LGTGSGVLRAARGVSRRGSDRSAERLRCRKNKAGGAPPPTADAPRNLHGKKGVNGSSPLEGVEAAGAGAVEAGGGLAGDVREAAFVGADAGAPFALR
jgi:hypothetical protein